MCTACSEWPQDVWFPGDVHEPLDDAVLKTITNHAVSSLFQRQTPTPNLINSLDESFLRKSQLVVQADVDTMLPHMASLWQKLATAPLPTGAVQMKTEEEEEDNVAVQPSTHACPPAPLQRTHFV